MSKEKTEILKRFSTSLNNTLEKLETQNQLVKKFHSKGK